MSAETSRRVNTAIRVQLLQEGSFYIVQTELKGEAYLRVSLMNPLTNSSHLQALLARIVEIGQNSKY
jgi:L-2,4-diaminobutyrate decarboxylase